MKIFIIYYSVHKKPYTDNPRSSIVTAENKENARKILEKYYEVENKHQLKISWMNEHDTNKEQLVALSL